MQKFWEIGWANNLNVQKDEILITVFFTFIFNVAQKSTWEIGSGYYFYNVT